MTLFAVMIGGALGSGLRYGVSIWLNPSLGGGVPWGTVAVNLIGCLLIGWISGLMVEGSEILKLGIVVGFLGGFTTFSSFGLEAIRLFQAGHINAAAFYILLSNAGGMLGAWLGYRLGQ